MFENSQFMIVEENDTEAPTLGSACPVLERGKDVFVVSNSQARVISYSKLMHDLVVPIKRSLHAFERCKT